ncbi:unnamed protein product [Prorocentrum cordatum]|uniref:Uncharacterized protein n=1 Tax=Prorocentrum cordatum TaxID=2364126 RepID=A0ABN9UT59_9DINO|nr:unnamed protein product [Polarella glacialis]
MSARAPFAGRARLSRPGGPAPPRTVAAASLGVSPSASGIGTAPRLLSPRMARRSRPRGRLALWALGACCAAPPTAAPRPRPQACWVPSGAAPAPRRSALSVLVGAAAGTAGRPRALADESCEAVCSQECAKEPNTAMRRACGEECAAACGSDDTSGGLGRPGFGGLEAQAEALIKKNVLDPLVNTRRLPQLCVHVPRPRQGEAGEECEGRGALHEGDGERGHSSSPRECHPGRQT